MSVFLVASKLGSFMSKNRFFSTKLTSMQEEMQMIRKIDKGLLGSGIKTIDNN